MKSFIFIYFKDKFANASAEEVGKLKKDIADFKEIIPEVAARIEGCELSIKEYDEVKSTLKDMMKETLTGILGFKYPLNNF